MVVLFAKKDLNVSGAFRSVSCDLLCGSIVGRIISVVLSYIFVRLV